MACVVIVLLAALLIPACPASGQIPPGFELVRITNDPDHETPARVNNCGQIVFTKWIDQDGLLSEILVYDNGVTAQITSNNVVDAHPDINGAGVITWARHLSITDSRIWLYRDGVKAELFAGRSPEINDHGAIAFKRYGAPSCRGYEMNIFLYDGESVTQITDAQGDAHQAVSLNEQGELAWIRYDFCPEIWESDVMLYRDGEVIEITADRIQPQRVDINDMGTVAWEAKDPDRDFRRFIELMQDGKRDIFAQDEGAPKLNNVGGIAFNPDDGNHHGSVFFEGEAYRVEFPGAEYTGMQDINDYGEVAVFLNYGYPESDLAILRRIRTGDSEFDGDIDIDDLAKLVECMTGPMWVERTDPAPEDTLCDCRFLDINHDGSVDLRDYAIFQENFGG